MVAHSVDAAAIGRIAIRDRNMAERQADRGRGVKLDHPVDIVRIYDRIGRAAGLNGEIPAGPQRVTHIQISLIMVFTYNAEDVGRAAC